MFRKNGLRNRRNIYYCDSLFFIHAIHTSGRVISTLAATNLPCYGFLCEGTSNYFLLSPVDVTLGASSLFH